jgi:hypothetical protein
MFVIMYGSESKLVHTTSSYESEAKKYVRLNSSEHPLTLIVQRHCILLRY